VSAIRSLVAFHCTQPFLNLPCTHKHHSYSTTDVTLFPPWSTTDVPLLLPWSTTDVPLVPPWSTSDVILLPSWSTNVMTQYYFTLGTQVA